MKNIFKYLYEFADDQFDKGNISKVDKMIIKDEIRIEIPRQVGKKSRYERLL